MGWARDGRSGGGGKENKEEDEENEHEEEKDDEAEDEDDNDKCEENADEDETGDEEPASRVTAWGSSRTTVKTRPREAQRPGWKNCPGGGLEGLNLWRPKDQATGMGGGKEKEDARV